MMRRARVGASLWCGAAMVVLLIGCAHEDWAGGVLAPVLLGLTIWAVWAVKKSTAVVRFTSVQIPIILAGWLLFGLVIGHHPYEGWSTIIDGILSLGEEELTASMASWIDDVAVWVSLIALVAGVITILRAHSGTTHTGQASAETTAPSLVGIVGEGAVSVGRSSAGAVGEGGAPVAAGSAVHAATVPSSDGAVGEGAVSVASGSAVPASTVVAGEDAASAGQLRLKLVISVVLATVGGLVWLSALQGIDFYARQYGTHRWRQFNSLVIILGVFMFPVFVGLLSAMFLLWSRWTSRWRTYLLRGCVVMATLWYAGAYLRGGVHAYYGASSLLKLIHRRLTGQRPASTTYVWADLALWGVCGALLLTATVLVFIWRDQVRRPVLAEQAADAT